jgi:hypothetical protein
MGERYKVDSRGCGNAGSVRKEQLRRKGGVRRQAEECRKTGKNEEGVFLKFPGLAWGTYEG